MENQTLNDIPVVESNSGTCTKCKNKGTKEKKTCSKCQETKKFLTWSLLISVPIFLFSIYGIVVAVRNLMEYLSQ